MSLGLHQNCRQQLILKIAEHLPQVRVQNRMFLERKSAVMLFLAESTLPQTGAIKNQLDEYIGEMPLFDFIYETLSRELYETQEYDSKSPSLPLTEVHGYENPTAVAERLVDEFNSLPWSYSLSIKCDNDFGQLFAQTIKNYQLGDSARLITPDDAHVAAYPLTSGIEARDRSLSSGLSLLSIPTPQSWDRSSTYLQVNASGFIGKYGETAALESVVSFLKAFCGIGVALRLLKVNFTYRSAPTKAKFFIHRSIGNGWQIEGTHELDGSLSDTFHDLIFHSLEGKLDTDSSKTLWMTGRLNEISCVFQNNSKARKIRLASQWLFDSYGGKNELLSFVQTTVVMEILLGEKAISDLMGLGELLRNRCAYLIGKSHKQREEVMNDFQAIYDVRSKIVHRGKTRLNLHERTLFSKLQWMCRRVIEEEVELLVKDSKQNE